MLARLAPTSSLLLFLTSFSINYVSMNNPLINPGIGTFFWMLLSFGVLVFVLGKWGWPMLLKSLTKREKDIEDSLNEAQKAREEMKQLTAHNEEILREAKRERDEIIRTANLRAERIAEDTKARAMAEADALIAKARQDIENEKNRAMVDLRNEIANLSIDIAQRLIESELSDPKKADALIKKELQEAHLN